MAYRKYSNINYSYWILKSTAVTSENLYSTCDKGLDLSFNYFGNPFFVYHCGTYSAEFSSCNFLRIVLLETGDFCRIILWTEDFFRSFISHVWNPVPFGLSQSVWGLSMYILINGVNTSHLKEFSRFHWYLMLNSNKAKRVVIKWDIYNFKPTSLT